MAGELKRIRRKFVNSANKELLNQLLDDLLEDGVLNDGEKNSIIEGNPITAERARAIIDIVKGKGDVASNKMIAVLQSRDPTLHAALGLSSEKPAPAAAPEPQLGQDGSGTLTHSTEDFWKGKQGQRDTYPAAKESIRHRVALLITNIKFTDTKYDRAGADKDEENMLKLLVALGYEVVKHRNLTGKEIDAAVIKFSNHEKLKKTDSVVVVIMSHGKRGAVLGVDWKRDKPDEFSIDNIYNHLDSKGCPALLDKPKIILIQACRGGNSGSVEVEDGFPRDAGHDDFEEGGVRIVNKEIDFLALLSSTPDTVSYRNPQDGSRLIRYFVAVVEASAHVDHIEELCRQVQQRFVDLKVTKQMPTKDRGTLIRHFYFFPGI